jgi:RNA polymerase sigma-70 factor, ECF subfamily
MGDTTDQMAWVRALAAGDDAARARLYDTFIADVLGWCRRLGGLGVDPEDAAHDVFVVAMARIGSFRGDSSMRTWMFGVTRRVLANARRRARTRRLREQLTGRRLAWAPDRGPGPASATLQREREQQVHRCLDALTSKHREVLVLCSLEERSAREASELLGVPEATVYSRLHYARAAFRKAASRQGLFHTERSDADAGSNGRGGHR